MDPEGVEEEPINWSLSLRQISCVLFAIYFVGTGFLLLATEIGLAEQWRISRIDGQQIAGCRASWIKTYWGERSESVNSIITSGDGYIIVGHTNSYDEGKGLYVIKINKKGNRVWEKAYAHQGPWTWGSIAEGDDGCYLIAVTADVSEEEWSYDTDIQLVKINRNGKLLWSRYYGVRGGDKNDWATSCTSSGDGCFIIVGSTFVGDDPDLYVLKVNADGDVVWEKSYGGEGVDTARAIIGSDDGFIIGGTTTSYGEDDPQTGIDAYLLKIDRMGEMVWDKSYPTETGDVVKAITSTGDGYLLVGKTVSNGWEGTDILVMKVDKNGEPEWRRTYGGENWDEAISIQVSVYGGYIISGGTDRSWTPGEKTTGIYVIKIDSTGELVWEYRYGGSHVSSIATRQEADGSFNLVSSTDGDIIVLKMQEVPGPDP